TFWLFKTYLHDHSSNPQSKAFKTSSRVLNKVHKIVFGISEQAHNENENINENILPVTVLASFVLASVGAPILLRWAGPLAISQARKPQQTDDFITDARQSQQRVSRSKTVSGIASRSQISEESFEGKAISQENLLPVTRTSSLDLTPNLSNPNRNHQQEPKRRPPNIDLRNCASLSSCATLSAVNPSPNMLITNTTQPKTATISRSNSYRNRMLSRGAWPLTPPPLSEAQKVKLLRQNYFRCETLFLTALEDISNKLVIVPKAARLSVLRAELALIAQDLPAEVDIPVICLRHYAEKVPFLLMVEVLRDDFSFDPNTSDNHALIEKLISERGSGRRRIFDLSESTQALSEMKNLNDVPQLALDQSLDSSKSSDNLTPINGACLSTNKLYDNGDLIPGILTPTTPGIFSYRPSSPNDKQMNILSNDRTLASEQTDFSALATHMRTASQMLNQLENTSGKRPKHEVAAIRAKIIASMQSLEEQNFSEVRDTQRLVGLEDIVMNAELTTETTEDENKDENTKISLGIETGAARMENDRKTGGIQRKGDEDDPSAATFGEAWSVKKERIRKSSPYGWMKNWDVLSVIVKTGADLRQEAFACQLIQVCHDIWEDAKVPVWVERMRILVTGESSGLIETITNGISLHSIKRSLTLATIESGQNPRRKIASLKDHFLKAYGLPESDAYLAAVDAFKRSLAAYSIISYVLQLKDRHNGNVLIDNEGHIIHIDFGFMLSNSPGSVGFEAAPFKLTQDYVDVLGGISSTHFDDYKKLCKQAFQALRHSADNLIDLVNIMGCESNMPCFAQGVQQVASSLRQRFQLQMSAEEAQQFVETDLITKSLGSYYTR
ncbi:hypothetical protein EPUL_002080, partial [Erysiphe pulchra]